MQVTYFKSAAEFRQWLEANHDRVSELWVGFWKKDSGRGGITYSEALDAALCFGWIDGIKKRVDDLAYTHRFTPRKPKSNWSLVNIRRGEELKRLGLMTPAGLKAFAARETYAFQNRPCKLDAAHVQTFKRNKKAWTFFQAQPPGYQRMGSLYVLTAKKEETRLKRLAHLMDESEKGRRLMQSTGKARAPE